MPKPNQEQIEAFVEENRKELELILDEIKPGLDRLIALGEKVGQPALVLQCEEYTFAIEPNPKVGENGGN